MQMVLRGLRQVEGSHSKFNIKLKSLEFPCDRFARLELHWRQRKYVNKSGPHQD